MNQFHFFNRTGQTCGRSRYRRGITMIELIVSAMLLITIMSFVTTLCLRINLVWKDIGQYRVAATELANQLERLTRLPINEASTSVNALQPSAISMRTLRKPEIRGKLIDDNLGARIVLQIDWQRRNPGKPVELVGWLTSMESAIDGDDANQGAANLTLRQNGEMKTTASFLYTEASQ